MTITDGLLICVTLVGPIMAVQVQKFIEAHRERRNRRMWIFQTLMATRAMRASSVEHVQALNLIEVFFDGKSASERKVRETWGLYRDFLYQPAIARDEAAAIAHNERGVDFLVNLLDAVGKSLGYHFDAVQLKRGGYYPQGHADDANHQAIIREGFARILSGKQAFPMNVVGFPVSEDALALQTKVQNALLATLTGKKPLEIKETGKE
jgi:hypothetical protein